MHDWFSTLVVSSSDQSLNLDTIYDKNGENYAHLHHGSRIGMSSVAKDSLKWPNGPWNNIPVVLWSIISNFWNVKRHLTVNIDLARYIAPGKWAVVGFYRSMAMVWNTNKWRIGGDDGSRRTARSIGLLIAVDRSLVTHTQNQRIENELMKLC